MKLVLFGEKCVNVTMVSIVGTFECHTLATKTVWEYCNNLHILSNFCGYCSTFPLEEIFQKIHQENALVFFRHSLQSDYRILMTPLLYKFQGMFAMFLRGKILICISLFARNDEYFWILPLIICSTSWPHLFLCVCWLLVFWVPYIICILILFQMYS